MIGVVAVLLGLSGVLVAGGAVAVARADRADEQRRRRGAFLAVAGIVVGLGAVGVVLLFITG